MPSCLAIPADTQSRYIEAAVNGVLIATLYAPNGNPQPGPKFEYKLAWMKRLLAHAAELYALDAPVVLAGDFNVVPTDADIYPTKSYVKNALVQPEPRALFRKILDQGWVDAIRTMHPDAPMYTFWDYKRNRWQRDAGLRIDHLLLNPKAAKRLVKAGVDREVRGIEGASDHAPAWIVLSDKPTVSRKAVRQSKKPSRPASGSGARRSAPVPRQPLLVIDGDSFAHRSYHALPKTILRRGGKPAGAILGFANLLLRLYREEQPRAVLVAWDTLEVPTYRHEEVSGISKRTRIRRRAARAAGSVAGLRCRLSAFKMRKRRASRLTIFWPPPRKRRKARRHRSDCQWRPRHVPARLRSHHHPLPRPRSARWHALVPTKFARDMASIPRRFRILSR